VNSLRHALPLTLPGEPGRRSLDPDCTPGRDAAALRDVGV
jgi:hypothetical protein